MREAKSGERGSSERGCEDGEETRQGTTHHSEGKGEGSEPRLLLSRRASLQTASWEGHGLHGPPPGLTGSGVWAAGASPSLSACSLLLSESSSARPALPEGAGAAPFPRVPLAGLKAGLTWTSFSEAFT